MENQPRIGRPKGSGQGYVRVQVFLSKEVIEWGKSQKGGLSKMLRKLLSAEMNKQTKNKTTE